MKKQELIHLHGLLAEISTHCQMAGDLEPDIDYYESLGVRPTSINQSKTDHKEAVFELARGITAELEADKETPFNPKYTEENPPGLGLKSTVPGIGYGRDEYETLASYATREGEVVTKAERST